MGRELEGTDAMLHHIAEELPEEVPHRETAHPQRADAAAVRSRRLHSPVTPKCRMVLRLVVYRIGPVHTVPEQALLEVVEVLQRVLHVLAPVTGLRQLPAQKTPQPNPVQVFLDDGAPDVRAYEGLGDSNTGIPVISTGAMPPCVSRIHFSIT